MSTGNKTVPTRRNKRTKVRPGPERRGGARQNSGTKPRSKATAIAECREELIEQLKAVTENPAVLGKHWIHPWVKMIIDPGELLRTTSGTKMLANLTEMIFCGGQPPTRPGSGVVKPSAEPESPQGGGIKLPPLMPDSADKEKAAA